MEKKAKTKPLMSSPVKLKVKTLGPTVRNRNERKKLKGFSCKQCSDYYETRHLSGDSLRKRLDECSRHRSQYSPPKSPEHFWETGFPSTPECIRRGTFNIEEPAKQSPKRPNKSTIKSLSDEFTKVADKEPNK